MRWEIPTASNSAATSRFCSVRGPAAAFGSAEPAPGRDGAAVGVPEAGERAGRTNRPVTRPSPMAATRMTVALRARTAAPPGPCTAGSEAADEAVPHEASGLMDAILDGAQGNVENLSHLDIRQVSEIAKHEGFDQSRMLLLQRGQRLHQVKAGSRDDTGRSRIHVFREDRMAVLRASAQRTVGGPGGIRGD